MEIVAITEIYWSAHGGEMVDTGVVIGYEARGCNGVVLGQGETIAEATEAEYVAMYLPESGAMPLTNGKFGYTLASKKAVSRRILRN